MYTIKQAAERTGIAIPTIRMWERRYGVVSPTRTPGGYRLYDDDSIARLAAMHYLVERDGWRPSQAADRIRTAPQAEVLQLAADGRGRDGMATAEAGTAVSPAIEAIVDATRRLDLRSIDATLDETFAGQRFEAAMDSVVFPALRGIGDAWSRRELDVAREHAASETVRRRIAHYFDAAAQNAGGATVVIGLPPGSRHELGAFAFAVAARRAGLDVVYLGADVPLEAWRQTIRDTDPGAVVVAVVARDDARRANDVVRELYADGARLVAVGGPSARAIRDDLGALPLPDRIEEAIPRLIEAISPTTR
jgi:MerR family transcriptional regulator, light-induced transcriptional regulator